MWTSNIYSHLSSYFFLTSAPDNPFLIILFVGLKDFAGPSFASSRLIIHFNDAWIRTKRDAVVTARQGNCTVKSSNFVLLFSKTIFFHWTFFRLPNNFFWHWSLYRMFLNDYESHFCLRQCLKVEFLGFQRMTKLDDCHLISSLLQICVVAMTTLNRGCECQNHFFDQYIL